MDSLREPEINLTERLLEQIKDVLNKDGIDVLLKKELKENVDSTKIPFRLVKQVHDELSKSGDGEFATGFVIISFRTCLNLVKWSVLFIYIHDIFN